MRKVDIIAALGFLGFAAVMALVVIPRESGEGAWHGLSPYFYPMVMLAGIALSSVGLLVQAISRPQEYAGQPRPMSLANLGFFLLAIVLVLAGVLVIHRFGMWIGGPLLIAAIMIFMGELNPVRIALVALPTVAFTYAIVTYALKIPLP